MKILIVDDEPENLKVMAEMLQENFQNASIIQTNKVDSALQIAKKTIPDIVITDWNMPGKSGIDLLMEIKAEEALCRIPVIMATGIKMSSQDLKTAFDAGASDYVRKPFDKLELIVRIESAYQLSQYSKQVLENANRNLTENALLLVKSNEFNVSITKQLESILIKLKGKDPSLAMELQKVLDEVDDNARRGSWQRFELAFEGSHESFKRNLLEKFPKLTKSEIKLSIFLKLGMSTKDIASVLYQTQESVKVSRSRLRKKIGLTTEQSLQVFLSGF